jgi:hypothetical protein
MQGIYCRPFKETPIYNSISNRTLFNQQNLYLLGYSLVGKDVLCISCLLYVGL